ncbi:YnbE family lipoprotein [Caenispirillum bisanense]|uniref:YnbE family lipoprotein n=1 Tax=Caenispirillum bisanense TaxID=414052 RepID=UPI0031D254DE
MIRPPLRPVLLPTSAMAVAAVLLLAACQPTVKVEAPDKPIVINLNVKIEQEIRVRVEKDVEDLFKERGDLF